MPSAGKLALCRQRGIGAIVDDHPGVLAACAGAGMACFALPWRWNRAAIAELSLPRTLSWREIGPLALAAASGACELRGVA